MNKKVVIIGALVLLGGGVFFYFKTKAKPKTNTTGSATAGTGTSDSVATDTSSTGTNTSGTGTNTSQSNTQTNQSTTVSGYGTTESPVVYNSVTTEISPATLSDLQAVVYLNKYADLNNAFYGDLQKAKEHWINLGKSEKRTIPLIKNSISTPAELSDDQAIIYLSKYPDLLNKFRVNLKLAKQHWVQLGKSEGRTIDIVV